MTAATKPQLEYRPSNTRGNGDHGWLKSYHTFNFASWYSEVPNHQAWGPLRVINEDRVTHHQGFPTHHHQEFEIFSIILSGAIDHKDSMGNQEILKRGDVQMTSAGTGIAHSEFNGGEGTEGLFFLQCWARPSTRRLPPTYYTRHFSDEEKLNKIIPIVAPLSFPNTTTEREGSGPAPIHSGLSVWTSILETGKSVTHDFKGFKGYLHLPMWSGYRGPTVPAPKAGATLKVTVGEETVELFEGDGLYFDHVHKVEVKIENSGEKQSEFVLFDLE